MVEFKWDAAKAAANLRKHQVSFGDAKSVLYDKFAMQFFHEDSYLEEERFLVLGMSSNAKLLIVCHCERQQSLVIRIISTRKASKRESAFYQGGKP